MAADIGNTIVEYFNESEGHSCGYCKGETTSVSNGMWAHAMTVEDYQSLIDRGWRRSGCYCYKPNMKITCCPQYPIRCEATEFKLTHSQKKVLKKMKSFLLTGKKPCGTKLDASNIDSVPAVEPQFEGAETKIQQELQLAAPVIKEQQRAAEPSEAGNRTEKIPLKKAKLRRLERRNMKSIPNNEDFMKHKKDVSKEKSLEDFIAESQDSNSVHRLDIKLIRSNPASAEFTETLEESHNLYVKYQVTIHNDKPQKCSLKQYKRFLVDSPLEKWKPSDGPSQGYGSFHQHYRIDGKLVAVAVLDILPSCVSSVYFYYDPDYSFLSLGTYSSLREISLVRELSLKCPELCWYYLGFYIHSCPKMRYKGQYHPSDLACPETYNWVPIANCIPRLEQNKYSRLDPDDDAKDENGIVDISRVMVLHRRQAMPYALYREVKRSSSDEVDVKRYASLVGNKCAARMLLYRP